MKKFVKLFVVLLAVCMVLSIFAACGKKDQKPTDDDKPVDNTPVDDNPTPDEPTHEHAWDEGKVTKEATCTEAGEKVYTCECGETKTEAIAALGHLWNEGEVTKEASIDAEGEKTFTCTVCGETKVEVIEKLPIPDEAPESIVTADAKYKLTGDFTYTYLYFNGDPETTEVVIPAYINGFKVVAIDDGAFKNADVHPAKITISEGIETIGASAFEGCTAITEIVIPDSVTEIGENAFKGCTGLISVKLGAGTKYIPANAFDACEKIEFVDLGDGLEELDPATFADSTYTLVQVIIGKNMVDLKGSFEDAVKYGKLVVIVNNSESADLITGSGVKAILNKIADAKLEDVDVRIEIDEDGYVFYLDENGKVFLMSYIGGGQKMDPDDDNEIIDSFKKILRLPESFGKDELSYAVYNLAFFSRNDIETVIFSEGVAGIGDFAFADTALKTLKLSKSVTEIGESAFDASKLTKVTIPATVTSIAVNAFQDCTKLAEVIFEGKDTTVDSTAFTGCAALKAATMPANADNTIRDAAPWENLTLTGTTIASNKFEGKTALKTVTFAASVNVIGTESFKDCTALTEITLLNNTSDTIFGDNAFKGCTAVTKITLPVTEAGDLIGHNADVKTALATVVFNGRPSAVTEAGIGNSLFKDCTTLTSVTLTGATAINKNTFENTGLTAITIPAEVTKIEMEAFKGLTLAITYEGTSAEWSAMTSALASNGWNEGLTVSSLTCAD